MASSHDATSAGAAAPCDDTAAMAVSDLRCTTFDVVARFESALGFLDNSRSYRQLLGLCRTTGTCPAPGVCREAAPAMAPPPRGSVFTASFRAAASPPRAGESAIIVDLATRRGALNLSDGTGNAFERMALPLERLRSEGGGLARLLAYWEALAETGSLVSDIDPVKLRELGFLRRIHVVDVSNPDPEKGVLEVRAPDAPAAASNMTHGSSLSKHPVRIAVKGASADYDAARRTQRPHLASVRSRLLEREFRYRRLILPFTSDGLRWDKLLVAIEAA